MPSKSKSQHNFMAMLAHTGSPKQRKMAYEYLRADGSKFSKKKKPKAKKPSTPKRKKK